MNFDTTTRRIQISTDLHCFVKMQKRARKLNMSIEQYISKILCDDSSGGSSRAGGNQSK